MTRERRAANAAELIERNAWLDLFAAAPPGAAAALALSSRRVGGMGLLASGAVAITEFNRAMATGVETPVTDADLEQVTAWFARHAVPSWAVQVSPAVGEDVRALLARRGAVASGNGWAKFLQSSDAAGKQQPINGSAVVPADAATAGIFGRVAQSGFGLPAPTADWFAALVGRPGWRSYLAIVEGEHAGACAMYVRDGSAWLGIDATLRAYRGRGVQSVLIARRVADARAAGVTVLTAETAQPASVDDPDAASFRNYRRAGFEPAYTRPNYRVAPSETPASTVPAT